MSVTSRTLFDCNNLIPTTDFYMKIEGSVTASTTTLKLVFHCGTNGWSLGYSGHWIYGNSFPYPIELNGETVNPIWHITKTEEAGDYKDVMSSTKYTYVVDAYSDLITVYKPYFSWEVTVASTDIATLFGGTTSFYDIENAPSYISCSSNGMAYHEEYTTSGSTPIYAYFWDIYDNAIKSEDATTVVYWEVNGKKYVKNADNSYSCSYTIPLEVFGESSTSESVIVKAEIYFGGQLYKTINQYNTVYSTMKLSEDVVPTISSVTLADKTNTPVPSSWGNVFIQGQSGLRISAISCAPTTGSSITRICMKLDSQTTGTITYDTNNLPQINTISAYGALTCTVTITDKRLRSASKSCTVNVISYSIPTFDSVRSSRANSAGSEDNDGTYFLSETEVSYSSCAGKNSITLSVDYKRTDTSTYGTATTITPGENTCGGDLDTEFSYDVRYKLQDAFTTIYYIDYVSTAIYLMHFLHGGRGVAFGQKATVENALDCSFKAIFRDDVVIMKSDGTEISLKSLAEKLSS